jgi:hypothetical protein
VKPDASKPTEAGTTPTDVVPANHTPWIGQDVQAPPDRQEKPAAPEASAPTAAAAPIEPTVQPTHAAAHDIKLQVSGEGDQHVEIRLTERRGDVFVAVRTPDTKLAGDLRQDLPVLSSRLEQSGYRTSTWQPATATERPRLTDPSVGTQAQGQQDQPRQNGREQQRHPQEQKPKAPVNPASPSQPKDTGKDFEWLLSSIR